jgi:hypothetical protein
MSVELPGASPEYVELFHHAGIERVGDLRPFDPHTLQLTLAEVNAGVNIVPTPPNQEATEVWLGVIEGLDDGEKILPSNEELPRKDPRKGSPP